MAAENEIQKELREIGPGLADLPVVNPYKLPSGYFDSLPGLVLRSIRSADALTPGEETRLLAPALSGLQQKPTFSVPDGYFEQLTANTMGSLERPGSESGKTAKLVSISSRKRFFQYAAAAAITGIVATGVWFLSTGSDNHPGNAVLAQTDERVIETQMQANGVSDSDMINYLDISLLPASAELSGTIADIDQDDIPLLLADVSDQELQYFLDHDDPRAEKLN